MCNTNQILIRQGATSIDSLFWLAHNNRIIKTMLHTVRPPILIIVVCSQGFRHKLSEHLISQQN
jgi:hypothetical protein